ncbi:phosphopantetheine-binding protein, partial [Streptomyces sp. NPDC059165]
MRSDPTAADTNGAAAATEMQMADVLAGVLHTEQVPVDGNFFTDLGADSMVMAQFCARIRKRDDLPTISMKDIYQHSTIHSLATAFTNTTPTNNHPPNNTTSTQPATETLLADILADILHTQQIPPDGNFFTDLGADSMVMAQFCARIRKRDDLPTIS